MLKHFLFNIDVDWPVDRIKLTKHRICQNINKYGSIQKLCSTLGHLKSFQIFCQIKLGLVGFSLVWLGLV